MHATDTRGSTGAGEAEVYGSSDGGGTAFKSLENFVSGTLTAITYAFTELASMHYGIHYIMMLHKYNIFLYSRVSKRTFSETSEPNTTTTTSPFTYLRARIKRREKTQLAFRRRRFF